MVELKGFFTMDVLSGIFHLLCSSICMLNLFNFFFFAAEDWFSSSNGWGYPEFLLLKDLNNASMGFLVNDTVIVEAEIIVMSELK